MNIKHVIPVYGTLLLILSLYAQLYPTVSVLIDADIDTLHTRNSSCYVSIKPIPTIKTSNHVTTSGSIILREKRNTATINIPKPKSGLVKMLVNFETNCFTTTYTIPYSIFSKNKNRIDISAQKIVVTTKRGMKTYTGIEKNKALCTAKSKRQKNIPYHAQRAGGLVSPHMRGKRTLRDILHDYKNMLQQPDSGEIIAHALIGEGYTQKKMTKKDLRLPGVLSEKQINTILDLLPE